MDSGSFDGGDDGVRYVEIYEIFPTEDAFFYGLELLDGVFIFRTLSLLKVQPLPMTRPQHPANLTNFV